VELLLDGLKAILVQPLLYFIKFSSIYFLYRMV